MSSPSRIYTSKKRPDRLWSRALFYFQPGEIKMSSQSQINANRQNAQQSTGPKTETGKAISSHNAVKTALTGVTILLPNEDVEAYKKLGAVLVERYQPVGTLEEHLVQSIINSEWRLLRIPNLEAGIYALGHAELADQFSPLELELQTYLKYERQLKNLSLQESRLRRMRDKDIAELRAIQTTRQEKEEAEKQATAQKQPAAKPEPPAAAAAPANPNQPEIGFEFSTAETA